MASEPEIRKNLKNLKKFVFFNKELIWKEGIGFLS